MKKILLLSAIVLELVSCKKETPVSNDLDPMLKPDYIQLNVDNYSGIYIRVY
jgi:hypothetical protein